MADLKNNTLVLYVFTNTLDTAGLFDLLIHFYMMISKEEVCNYTFNKQFYVCSYRLPQSKNYN